MIQFQDSTEENAYRNEQMRFYHKRIRTGMLWGLFFYPLFTLLDYTVYPESFRYFLILRIIGESTLIIGLLYTKLSKSYRYTQFVADFVYLVLIGGILAMIHLADGYLSTYYAGILLVLLFMIFLCPLDSHHAMAITLTVLAGYLIPIVLRGNISQLPVLIARLTFMTAVIMFVNISVYVAERLRYREFIYSYRLAGANEKLKEMDRIKSNFFTNLSHEVRTPLSSILAPLQSLRQGDVGVLNANQREMMDIIYGNSIRLLDLINQMLDFDKLEKGCSALRLSKLNVRDHTSHIVKLFGESAAVKGLDLDFECRESCDKEIFIDTDRYERIVTNLIRNALKFTESGGVSVELIPEENDFTLKVTDTGIGIPKDHLNRVFKRFERVDHSSTMAYQGTGLGLSIVKESVEILHGSITADSVVGMGSVFTVLIPMNLETLVPDADIVETSFVATGNEGTNKVALEMLAELTEAESRAASSGGFLRRPFYPSPEEPIKGYRIVVCEDDGDLRHYIAGMLNRLGHETKTAINGQEAMEILAFGHTDLIVTDVMMPKMDGYELLAAVRDDEILHDLPVIMITAKHGEDPKLKALDIGADDYLPKPVNVRELDARIRNIISSRAYAKAAAEREFREKIAEELRLGLAKTLEFRDAETSSHGNMVLRIGGLIAAKLGIQQDRVFIDSLLFHDIGKLALPDSVLKNQGTLSPDEMELIKTHPDLGYGLLEGFENLKETAAVIRCHQEHWDGSGYPRGLKETEIPLTARIIAVADAYHAIISDRPYRKARSPLEALKEIKDCAGTQFDPEVVNALLRIDTAELIESLSPAMSIDAATLQGTNR